MSLSPRQADHGRGSRKGRGGRRYGAQHARCNSQRHYKRPHVVLDAHEHPLEVEESHKQFLKFVKSRSLAREPVVQDFKKYNLQLRKKLKHDPEQVLQ